MKILFIVFSNYDELEIIGHPDSDFVGSPDDMKSASGYTFKLLVVRFHGEVLNRLL